MNAEEFFNLGNEEFEDFISSEISRTREIDEILLEILHLDNSVSIMADYRRAVSFSDDRNLTFFQNFFYPFIKLLEQNSLHFFLDGLNSEQKSTLINLPSEYMKLVTEPINSDFQPVDEVALFVEYSLGFINQVEHVKMSKLLAALNTVFHAMHRPNDVHFHLQYKGAETKTLLTFDPTEQPNFRNSHDYKNHPHRLYYQPHNTKRRKGLRYVDVNKEIIPSSRKHIYKSCITTLINYRPYEKADFIKPSKSATVLITN
ncbi:MAG: hypothetical protein KKD31_19500 [Bacteroidetes bacterium]|nr:hypothetical protein [Bacteroidota bacterium]